MVEGARLESVFRGNSNVGSNPTLSARAAKSDFIVTEDKDLLRVGQFGNARIVSTREFVKLALTQNAQRPPRQT